jgi:hypothetical protein
MRSALVSSFCGSKSAREKTVVGAVQAVERHAIVTDLDRQGQVLWWDSYFSILLLVSGGLCDRVEHIFCSRPSQSLLTTKSQNLGLIAHSTFAREIRDIGRIELHVFCVVFASFAKVSDQMPRVAQPLVAYGHHMFVLSLSFLPSQ